MKVAFLCILAGLAGAVDQSCALARRQSTGLKTAPDFTLRDASGKTVQLADYRGKVVLLDFWATWCTGCKEEIPWFSAFQRKYGARGFDVIGVSLDDGGWSVLRPFLAEHDVPYRMLLGDEATAHRFGIGAMPDTYLIDRTGRIVAAYTGTLVNKEDVEGKIKALL